MGAHNSVIRRSLAVLAPESLRSWVSYYTPQHSFSPIEVERVRESILRQMDPAYVRQLWGRSGEAAGTSGISREEFNKRLRIAILRAVRLGLHREPKLSVLDIGCGAGFFVAVAQHFHHDCVGGDLPAEMLSPAMKATYQLGMQALGCNEQRRVLAVKPYEPLAVGRKFDLITAGLICFNEYPSGATWSRPEWEFFLTDVARYCHTGGRLYLEFNEHRQYGALRWYDEPTRALFNRSGVLSRNKFIYTRR
jgi:SAM-dependent methyltransferase